MEYSSLGDIRESNLKRILAAKYFGVKIFHKRRWTRSPLAEVYDTKSERSATWEISAGVVGVLALCNG
jgi:hypothetical protein